MYLRLFGSRRTDPYIWDGSTMFVQAKRKEKSSKAWQERRQAQTDQQEKKQNKWVAGSLCVCVCARTCVGRLRKRVRKCVPAL